MRQESKVAPALDFLSEITRDEITPYDVNFFQRSPKFAVMLTHCQSVFSQLKLAVNSMTEGMFKWEEELEPSSWQSDLILICRTFNSLPEKQMVDLVHLSSFVEIIDPSTLRILIESSEELFENPERLINLGLISQVFELFMRMVFLSDINYLPRIDSGHMALIDPFNRTRIRDTNRKNLEFNQKYVKNDLFEIKKFISYNLENLFITNKARALGEGLRRMRLNLLKMIKALFELGLWHTDEVPSLLESLHSKLQMLFVEENEFGDDYNPESNERSCAYNPSYHECLASIINHVCILDADEGFKSCMPSWQIGGGHTLTDGEKITKAISKLYFNNKDKFNRLNFLFFDGILHSLGDLADENGRTNEKEVYASRSTFMNLFDINNDQFLLSTDSLNSSTIQNYQDMDQ